VHFVALVRRRRVSATKRTVWVHNVAPSAVGGVSATKCTLASVGFVAMIAPRPTSATKPTQEEGFVAAAGVAAPFATKPTLTHPLPYQPQLPFAEAAGSA
jgi:hypothetical protein